MSSNFQSVFLGKLQAVAFNYGILSVPETDGSFSAAHVQLLDLINTAAGGDSVSATNYQAQVVGLCRAILVARGGVVPSDSAASNFRSVHISVIEAIATLEAS